MPVSPVWSGLPNTAISLLDHYGVTPIVRTLGKAVGLTAPDKPLIGTDSPIADRFPSGEAVAKSLEPVTGPAYKPQTTAGEVAHTLGEFAPNALAGGRRRCSPARRRDGSPDRVRVAARRADLLGGGTLGQVVAPALVSEGAGRVARDVAPDYEPAARFAGALAGGIGAAVAQAPRGAAAVREGLKASRPSSSARRRPFATRRALSPAVGSTCRSTRR